MDLASSFTLASRLARDFASAGISVHRYTRPAKWPTRKGTSTSSCARAIWSPVWQGWNPNRCLEPCTLDQVAEVSNCYVTVKLRDETEAGADLVFASTSYGHLTARQGCSTPELDSGKLFMPRSLLTLAEARAYHRMEHFFQASCLVVVFSRWPVFLRLYS